MNSGSSTFDCLFQPNATFSAVLKDNKIVFFTGDGAEKNKFDIYNIATNTWSIGVLPQSITGAAIISVNNKIYVAGGDINGVLSNQVQWTKIKGTASLTIVSATAAVTKVNNLKVGA